MTSPPDSTARAVVPRRERTRPLQPSTSNTACQEQQPAERALGLWTAHSWAEDRASRSKGPPDLQVDFLPAYRLVITGPALDYEVIRVTSREQLQKALTRLPTEGSYTLFYPTGAGGEQPEAAQELEDVLRSHGLKSGGPPAKADMKRIFQLSNGTG